MGTSSTKTHGMSGTRIYGIYAGMKSRCTNKKYIDYPNYGGRGIEISAEWNTFEAFYRDMGDKPKGKSLERKDNDKGYSKDNCYWGSTNEQANNRRSSIKITRQGETLTLKQWCQKLGINYSLARDRIINQKWDIEEALCTFTIEQYKIILKNMGVCPEKARAALQNAC
jgi:hypothetical protein